jgi:methionine synthase / methylenetetrahydrofolate reductase(NADPH)
MDFLDELQHRILPGDGAMGTALMDAGVARDACFEELCVSRPEAVRAVHEQAIAAGARLIETNSFGANAVRLARHGHEHRVSEINWSAAQLAKDVARGTGVHVAGSVGSLGISAAEAEARGIDRQEVFTEQIGALLDGGARVIFLETFLDLEELLLAVHVKHALHHCPVIASLACPDDGRLPDGTTLAEAFAKLRAADADVVGINCVNGPAAAMGLLANISDDGPMAAFPSAGLPMQRDGRLVYPAMPEDFAEAAGELGRKGVRLIGGCCGTGPAHIAAIAEALAAFVQENETQSGGEHR